MLKGFTSNKCRSFVPALPETEAEPAEPAAVLPPKRRPGRPKGSRQREKAVPTYHETVLGVRHGDHAGIPPQIWIALAILTASFFRGLVKIVEKLQVGASGYEQETILFRELPKLMFRTVCKLATQWWSYDNGYLGPVLKCDRCGGDMHCRDNRAKTLTSLFGPCRPARAYYVCSNPKCTVPLKKDPTRTRRYSVFPLDIRLGVDDTSFLPGVNEVVTWMTSMDPYGKCLELIEKLLSFSISHRTAWLITQQVGNEVKAREDEEIARAFKDPVAPVWPQAQVETAPAIGVIEVDGTFVPIGPAMGDEPGETEEEDNPDAPPRRKGFKEIKAGLVAHLVPPVPKRGSSRPPHAEAADQTPQGVPTQAPAPPFEETESKGKHRRRVRPPGEEPTLEHKKLAVHLGQPLRLFQQLLLLVYQLGLPHTSVILVIGDGAKWIWTGVREHLAALGPRIVEILDFWHGVEHLWTFANAAYGQGAKETAAWVNQRQTELLTGLLDQFFQALQDLAAKTETMGESIAKIGKDELRYFRNNESRIHYAEYLAAGYLIGSGAMEGTNNYHVKGRADRSGMRWKPPGVMAVLRNRTLIGNGDWDDFWRQQADARHQRYLQQVARLKGQPPTVAR